MAAGSATALLVVWQAWLLAHMIAAAGEPGDRSGLAPAFGLLGLVLLGRAGLSWLTTWLAHRSAAAVKSQLRNEILAARLSRPSSDTSTAHLVTLVTQGLDALDGYFSQYLPQLMLALTVPLITGAAVLFADWRSAVILALTLPLIPLFMALVGWATETQVRRRWRHQTRLASHFADLVTGLPTLQVFSRARAQAEGLLRTERANRAETMHTLRISFLSAFVLELLTTLAVAIVAVTIGTRLVYHGVDFTTALFVLVLAPEVYLPVRQVGVHYHNSADGVAAAESAFAEIDRAAEQGLAGEPADWHPGLVISEVSHRYHETVALAPVSLSLAPGEVVALTGPSGAGKSTLLLALLGLLNPTEGQISLEGRGLATTGIEAWRRQLAYVPQTPGMVAGDVADNVRIGWEPACDQEVRQALARAGAAGLDTDTPVSDDGEGLSAGQRRRVAIARALLRIDLDDADRHLTRIGQVGTLNGGERVMITSYQVGSAVSYSGNRFYISSDQMLVVHFWLEADVPGDTRFFQVMVRSGERTLAGLDRIQTGPAPGFRMIYDVAFEISTGDLAAAQVEFRQGGIFQSWDRVVVVDLGITEEQAQQLAEQGRYQTIPVSNPRQEVQ